MRKQDARFKDGVARSDTDLASYRYWAFISYSSKDKSWARWLHRAIETYRIPARLVNHPTPIGEPAPKRFTPLFYDRAELPASSDLGAEIDAALRASRYLIVVCSPHAAQSTWVNKEVETFQCLGRTGRLLAIIVNGKPNAGDERECFPPALRTIEPIAADVRPEGDGKGNATLKLLAGMLGVGYDALKQRDTHRRIRRLQFMIALVLVIALGLGFLALYAKRQRDKAVKSRQQAENILEYLLFDLRDKLKPVGRLDIVQDIQRQVDAYYRELGSEEGGLGVLRNRMVAHNNNGDRALAQGDLAGALRYYRAALAISDGLASSNPSTVFVERDVSVSHMKVGSVLQTQGDLPGALREYRAALVIRERLVSSSPSNVYLQWDLFSSHNHVGHVLQEQGDFSGALSEHRQALAIMESIAASDPANSDWQHELSVNHGLIGVVLQAQGDLAGSLRAHRAGLAIMEQLVSSDPNNTKLQANLAASHNNLGAALEAKGDLAGALREYKIGLAIMQHIAPLDPSNLTWLKAMSASQYNVDRMIQARRDTLR